ncbi:AbrB/MazE/SpoVT family DNA-binding domain-containing protein [Limosilactobacillus reuteri]|uniref:AbrB/MazE/SpoVT family DNA-binding domain-containing protein n=1 Tax=Limosilactobacillus reuteri TaxID=1598 RepID=UPI001C0B3C58|nr:AbrB/MazE/SpoVT family DNA-binding domain-containing protein [Limosilactobacillus reuteri]QWS03463.1 AbrB/MazE/SpoVT family DNA-binding domain-containing protein [Limosilactobacillus reuteri]
MESTKGVLTLSKWGNSLSIRIPKNVLDILKLSNNDKVSYQLKDDKIILKPEKNESPLRKMFDGFDTEAYFKNEPKNKEIDWGKPQGKEIF